MISSFSWQDISVESLWFYMGGLTRRKELIIQCKIDFIKNKKSNVFVGYTPGWVINLEMRLGQLSCTNWQTRLSVEYAPTLGTSFPNKSLVKKEVGAMELALNDETGIGHWNSFSQETCFMLNPTSIRTFSFSWLFAACQQARQFGFIFK